MSVQAIIKEIKEKKFKPVYFLHGEEPYFIDQIEHEIFHHALEDHERDFNQTIIYGKDADVPVLLGELNSYPSMAERRLVILREAQDFKKIDELVKYFEKPNNSTVFVVCYKYNNYDARKAELKAATKNGLVFKSEKIKDYNVGNFVTEHCKEIGFTISDKAKMLLVDHLGNDLSKIINELSKLAIILEKGTQINDVHIEENIGISKDYNVFELTNALQSKDFLKAMKIVHYFDHHPKNGDINAVIPQIYRFFNQIMVIQFLQNKSKENVASTLKIHPFAADGMIKAAHFYPPAITARNISILHEFDLKAKGVNNPSTRSGALMYEMIFRLLA